MSNIIYSTINENFPQQGIDNPSQGFRTNFASIKGALQQTHVEMQAVQSVVQQSISPTGVWIGSPVGLQGPPGINYNTTLIEDLGDFSDVDSDIPIIPANAGSKIFLARLTGTDMTGTISVSPLAANQYGECVLMVSSTGDGTNSMIVEAPVAKWVNGNQVAVSPLINETVGLYVQSIAGTLFMSIAIWF